MSDIIYPTCDSSYTKSAWGNLDRETTPATLRIMEHVLERQYPEARHCRRCGDVWDERARRENRQVRDMLAKVGRAP